MAENTEVNFDETAWVTVGVQLNSDSPKLYTYKCNLPVGVGDQVNVKLPRGAIRTVPVREVHATPQLSDKWETKWCVVIQTAEEFAASQEQSSDLGKELGL